MDLKEMEAQIRKTAREWLEKGEVKYVIGYERGAASPDARPVFVYKPEDADKLVWDDGCVNNLTLYVVNEMRKKPKRGETPDTRPIGVVVKPCDSKTLIELMKELVVLRERIRIIGVVCQGVTDAKTGNTADKCGVCDHHNPVVADIVIGDPVEETGTDDFSDLAELEAMSVDELWEFWKGEVDKCVRCYACRNTCPLCYCEECVFDQVKPFAWNEKSVELSENMFYHITRAMHLAGRCVDCGECERVCPMDIPLRKLNRYLAKRVKDRFGTKAGENQDEESVFGTYDTKDPGEEIW